MNIKLKAGMRVHWKNNKSDCNYGEIIGFYLDQDDPSNGIQVSVQWDDGVVIDGYNHEDFCKNGDMEIVG